MSEKQDALRLLNGLENGRLSSVETATLAENLDPVLIYVIVSYLRETHPASDPVASAVLQRVVALTSGNTALVRKHREGAEDPIARWFESEHEYRDFRGRGEELIEHVVEKLES